MVLFAEKPNFLAASCCNVDVIKGGEGCRFLSLLSTIYPAWRASKIEPANILRYE